MGLCGEERPVLVVVPATTKEIDMAKNSVKWSPCECPEFGSEAYFKLLDRRHGRR